MLHSSHSGLNRSIYTFYFILFTSYLFLSTSCTSYKPSAYFRSIPTDTVVAGILDPHLEMKIRKNDLLLVSVSSLNPEADAVFNAAGNKMNVLGKDADMPAFAVDETGFIQLHHLGNVKAEGLTRRELKAKLEKDLASYLKDPVVTVRFQSNKITVMGEVARPAVINIPEEKITLPDALAMSGDLTLMGRRDNLLIIREDGLDRKIKRVNLEDHSIFSSPWYFVQPNDIIYVSPDDDKRYKDEKRTRFYTNVSLILSSLSLLIIIIDRLIK